VRDTSLERFKSLTLTPRSAFLFCLISVATLPFSDSRSADGVSDILNELLLGVIATTSMFAVILPTVAVVNWFSGPGWSRQWIVLGAIVAGATIRGAMIFWLGPAFDFVSSADMGQRLVNSVTTSVTWLVLLSMVANASETFRSRYSSYFSRIALSRTTQMPHSEFVGLLAGLEVALKNVPVPTRLGKESADHLAKQMQSAAGALELEIVSRIKASSRSLWRFDQAKTPRLRAFRLVALAVTRLDYSIFVVATFIAVGTLVNLATTLGWAESLFRVSIATLILIGLHSLYRVAVAPRWSNRGVINAAYLLILGFAYAASLGVGEYFSTNSPIAIVFVTLIAVSTAALPALHSMVRLAGAAREEIVDVLRDIENRRGSPGNQQMMSTDEVASYLHNSLQSEVQSLILTLRKNSTESGPRETADALTRLEELVTRPLQEDFFAYALEPLQKLDEAIRKWRGILDINLVWADRPAVSGRQEASVVQIIEELASNAVLHGEATKLRVTVRARSGGYDIQTENNGHERVSSSGQGSRWLEGFVAEPRDEAAQTRSSRRHYRV